MIEKAFAIKKLDCDNKKSGNPPKVDIFRKVFLGQYLDEALFLMQLIGVKVFSDTKTSSKKKKKASAKPAINIMAPPTDAPEMHEPNLTNKPDLPESSQKIGAFIYETMRGLESVGYSFSSDEIDAMCTPEWSKDIFHTIKPFMKKFVSGVTDNKGTDGCVRFRSEPFTFGGQQVLISKEWYERQRQYFIDWYKSLT